MGSVVGAGEGSGVGSAVGAGMGIVVGAGTGDGVGSADGAGVGGGRGQPHSSVRVTQSSGGDSSAQGVIYPDGDATAAAAGVGVE